MRDNYVRVIATWWLTVYLLCNCHIRISNSLLFLGT